MTESTGTPALARTPARRSVLKASAWSVPLIALAIAAPLVSASPSGPGVLIAAAAPNLDSIPSGGGSSPFTLTLTNNNADATGPLTVWISRLTGFAGLTDELTDYTTSGWSLSEDADNFILVYGAGLQPGQSSDTFSGTWTVTKGVQAAYTGVSTVQLNPAQPNTTGTTLAFATSASPLAILLGLAASYLILAKGALTVVGTSSLLTGGLVGVESGPYTNIPPVAAVKGTSAQNAQAKLDTEAAYGAAANAGPATTVAAQLGGLRLTPGVYHQTAALGLTGVLSFDAQGDPDAAFIIQSGGAITTAAASSMVLLNGASASNIFWVSVGAISVGGVATFYGTALSGAAITVGEGATVVGRLLTTIADVTISNITMNMYA
ncbi:MAG: hypothetical protein JWR01_2837 [Subtercola sp.]|nr:hypothetical protein [Subtercola sp.]